MENEKLLKTFNKYLNSQEKKAVAPRLNSQREIVLQEQDYKIKMDDKQQQDDENYLDFQLINKNKNEEKLEGQGMIKKVHNIRPEPLTDDERYKKMKNVLKAVKTESIENGMLSTHDLMEWAMSSAVIDGASTEFMDIINAMKGISEVFNESNAAWEKYDKAMEKKVTVVETQEEKEAIKNDVEKAAKKAAWEAAQKAVEDEIDATELAYNAAAKKCHDMYFVLAKKARKYVDSHDGFKWTGKGKKRLAFANYILSSNFIEKNVVKFRKTQYKDELTFSENLDGDSFILAYELKNDSRKIQDAVSDDLFDGNKQVKAKYDGFKLGSPERTPTRTLYDPSKMLSSDEEMAAEREKVTNAMENYAGIKVKGLDKDGKEKVKTFVDKEPMFALLDDIVEEVCKYKITKEIFTKEYYLKRPYEVLKIRRMSNILGDCLDEKGDAQLGGDLGKEYLELLKDSPSYTKFYTKLTFMYGLWYSVLEFMEVGVGFRAETIIARSVSHPDGVIDHTQFTGTPLEEYDEDGFANLEKTPEDWLDYALDYGKKDSHVRDNEGMKKYMNSSIFSSIRVPKRAKKSSKRK